MRTDKVVTRRNTEKAIARIESFSDSVFGFAITLLVLDLLQIPHPAIEQNLIQSFLTHWQSLLAFLVGFCTILICWISHHHFFCYLIRYDAKFLWLNGILLLIITFTPLPTSIFAEFILRENNVGLILFGLTYFAIACVADAFWTYSYKKFLLDENEDETYYRSTLMIYRSSTFYTLVAFIMCFVSNSIAIAMYVVLFSVFAFPHYFTLRLQRYLSKVNGTTKK